MKIYKALIITFFYTVLTGCESDITQQFELGALKKDEIYELKESVFLRVYNDTKSIHPEKTPHWAPLSIQEFKQNPVNKFFIVDIIPNGTLLKFTGVKSRYDPVANQSVVNYYGDIVSGKYSGYKVIVYDLLVKNNRFSSVLANKYFGI
jgi:hypothetical protein